MSRRAGLGFACAIALGVAATGCGASGSSTRRASTSARAATTVTTPAPSTAANVSAAIARAVRAMDSAPHTTTAHVAFRLNAGHTPAARLAPWQTVFPRAVTTSDVSAGGRQTLTERTPTRQMKYLIDPGQVSIVTGGRRRRANPAEVRTIDDALAARRDLLSRLSGTGPWRVTGRSGAGRRLTLDAAQPALAADLVPGYLHHPAAIRQVRLRIDATVGRTGRLGGLHVALSCLVNLNAIARRPAPRPAWIGLGMVSADAVRYGMP